MKRKRQDSFWRILHKRLNTFRVFFKNAKEVRIYRKKFSLLICDEFKGTVIRNKEMGDRTK
jgi:hypothetical protein